MSKLVNCKACNTEISASAKSCPSCGHKNKKPFFKKLWFYAVIVVVISIVAIASSGESEQPVSNAASNNAPTASNSESEDPTNEVEAAKQSEQSAPNENDSSQETAVSDSEFDTLTPLQIYKTIEENPDIPFTVSPKAEVFLKEHTELFPNTVGIDKLMEYTDFELETKHVNKNPNNYGDKLMYVGTAYVNQIFEEEITPSLFLTALNLVDGYGDQYYTFYIGQLNDVFEYDEVEVYGLPLNTSSFENTDGGTTLVVVLAGSYIEKIEY